MKKYAFFVQCPESKELITLGPAPAPEPDEQLTHRGVQIACPRCGVQHTYRGAEVGRGELDSEDE
jgi:hypothetical protein